MPDFTPPPTVTFEPGQLLCAEDLVALQTTITEWVCDVLTSGANFDVPPNVVLADGSVPMDGCLLLPGGCVEPQAAATNAQLEEVKAMIKPQCVVGATIEGFTTDMNGLACVPITGLSTIDSVVGNPFNQNYSVSIASQSPTSVCFLFVNMNGAVVANTDVDFNYVAIGT